MNSIIRLLNPRGYITFNKDIAKAHGIHVALVLAYLADRYCFHEDNGTLNEKKGFYTLLSDIMDNTVLSERKARDAVKYLEDTGVLQTKLEGVPAKRFFYFTDKLNNFIDKVYSVKADENLKKTCGTVRANPCKNARVKGGDFARDTIYIQPNIIQPKEEDPLYPPLTLPTTVSEPEHQRGMHEPEIDFFPKEKNHAKQESKPKPSADKAVLEERFKQFYAMYPRKKAPQEAKKAFLKLKPDEALLNSMLEAIEAQARSPDWQKDNGRFIPYPASWLNGRRWEDEIDVYTTESREELEAKYFKMIDRKAPRYEIMAFCKKHNLFVEWWFTEEEIASWAK